ncbi:MAG: glycosyltransferase family 39 protein [Lachnospiraceae bacterium]|nr:glycosyltransferase family 39 protein [Lachnospiraceae bacterium]
MQIENDKIEKQKVFRKFVEFFGSLIATKVIFVFALILRFIAFLLSLPYINQHDVIQRYGHFDYAMYLFMYGKLPPIADYEFAQPPVNAFLQAMVMKFLSLFKDYTGNYLDLYAYTKILTLIYSILTLVIIYKILNEFDIPRAMKNFVLAIMSFYPGLVIMATQYSNDPLAYMFFYLSLYLTVKWCKNKKLSTIILLALSIGLGMLTKISVGLIAFITGPMMLVVLFRSFRSGAEEHKVGHREIISQLVIFGLIVFPIGLSFSIRNYLLFGMKFGEIFEIVGESLMAMRHWNWTFVDRFLSFPVWRIVETNTDVYSGLRESSSWLTETIPPTVNGIYHSYVEYNVWIDLIKTATHDEFNFSNTLWHPLCVVLYVGNYIFHIFGICTMVLNISDLIVGIKNRTLSHEDPILNLRIMSIMLFILAIVAYVGFNIKYPYSCNSNYRYIAYITFAFAISIAIKCLQKRAK